MITSFPRCQKLTINSPLFLTFLTILYLTVCCVKIDLARAVAADTALYADQYQTRVDAYDKKETSLVARIGAATNAEEIQSLQLQLQLVGKLKELKEGAQKPSLDLPVSITASHESVGWKDFEQYLDKYTSLEKEGKISRNNLESITKQQETFYTQLLALGENDPEQDILQLKHAYQSRKFALQEEIDTNINNSIKTLKDLFPSLLKRIHTKPPAFEQQLKTLQQASRELDELKQTTALASAKHEVFIQQQESLLAGYLGQDLSTDSEKKMHYDQLKLLIRQVQKLLDDSHLLGAEIIVSQEAQKTLWFELFGGRKNFLKFADMSGDQNKAIIRQRKETTDLQDQLHTYETQLSGLRGDDTLIGPKATELIETLEKEMQTAAIQLSSTLQRAESIENQAHLLEKAIALQQSSLASMFTKTFEATNNIIEKIFRILRYPLLSYNGMTLSLLLLLEILGLLLLSIFINRIYGRSIARIGLRRNWTERTIHLVQATGKYPFIFIIAMVILSIVGINTSSLALVAGALSVGIGFGMQTIVNNLVSGIILLFDKSIRPGDFISLGDSPTGGFRGNVVQMNIRATVLRTNDNINIIIPNADLMAAKVVNWTYGDDKIRFRIPFSIAYGTDINRTKSLIKEAILTLPVVLGHPAPQIWMTEHASSSLNFVAAIWVEGQNARQPARTSDAVLTKIYTTLAENNIEIPFPQMDLRFREHPEQQQQKLEVETITTHLREKLDREPLTV